MDYDPQALEPELSKIHFTIGGPYFTEYADGRHASPWQAGREDMPICVRRKDPPAEIGQANAGVESARTPRPPVRQELNLERRR